MLRSLRASFAADERRRRRSAGEPFRDQPKNSTLLTGLRDFVPFVFEPERPVEVPRTHRLTFAFPTWKTNLALIVVRKPGIVVSDQWSFPAFAVGTS